MSPIRVTGRLSLTLERKILAELVKNLVLILCVMTGVFLVGSLIQFLARAPELGLGVVISVIPQLLPSLAVWTIPSSLLLASIMTFGRMGEDNEITAIRAGGVPVYHVVLPALFLGMMLSGVCVLLNATVVPASLHSQRRIAQNLLVRFRSILENARDNTYVFDERRLSWQRIDEEGALVGLTIDRRDPEGGGGEILIADRARIETDEAEEHLVFRLQGVTVERRDETGAVTSGGSMARLPLVLRIEDMLGRMSRSKPKELGLEDLHYAIYRRGQRRLNLPELHEELHERLVLGFAPFVLSLLGASIGILARRGAFMLSFLLAFVAAGVPYYGMVMVGRALIESRIMSAPLALWPANVIMGLFGLVLLRKAIRG